MDPNLIGPLFARPRTHPTDLNLRMPRVLACLLLLLLASPVALATNANAGGPKACNDGIDNDGDGAIDYPADPGCANNADNDETNAPAPAACSDGIDNDSDGKVDYPTDPGCTSASDNDEYDVPPAECSDGIDNDLDGKVDYPADSDCGSASDDQEFVSSPVSSCPVPNYYQTGLCDFVLYEVAFVLGQV